MKKTLSFIVILLLSASLYATDTGSVTTVETVLTFAPGQDSTQTDTSVEKELEEQEKQTLDAIMEDDDWKNRLPGVTKEWNNWRKERDEDWGKSHKSGFFKGGAGGWDLYYLPLNVEEINFKLAGIGLPYFPTAMILTGGGGWGFIGKGIRVGGMGAGGTVTSSGELTDAPGIAVDVELSLGYGGFTIEKVFHPFNDSEFYLGTMIGGGNATLKMTKWSGPVKWRDVWDKGFSGTRDTTYNDYQSSIGTSFFSLLPSVGFRYNIFRWFAVGGNVGYLYQWTDQQTWKMENKNVTGVPKVDFSGVIYRVNFYFGG